jgi:hypothetical protein
MEGKRIYVEIYCKIYTDNFEGLIGDFTGEEIFDFLTSSCGCSFDPSTENIVDGDLNLWYLGCNEKFGLMKVDETEYAWSFGESSFDRVQSFIDDLNGRGLFTEDRYRTLCEKIQEGRQIDDMYEIGNYLTAKRDGKPWIKPESDMREGMKRLLNVVVKKFEGDGYKVYHP